MADIATFLVGNAAPVQTLLFGVVIVSCWAFEGAALGSGLGRKRRRASVNAMFALCGLPIQIGMTALIVALASWVTRHHWGLLHLIPGSGNAWIRFGLMFVVLDFLDYVYHVTMHRVPLFWRFHLVHHTDRDVDASTTVREHPGETVMRNGFLLGWVLLTGVSLEVLVLRQTVETVANILAHTSFRLGNRAARVVGTVLITPNLHHVHHHQCLPYTNRNYGDVFSVWDRMFGTYAALDRGRTVFGLDVQAHATDAAFREALALPFTEIKFQAEVPGSVMPVPG